MTDRDGTDFKVLVTAEEAWPAFERAVLGAQEEIVAGFRIFDMATKLRSSEARAVGEDWFDLLAHALARGVNFHLIVSDFDAVMATELHECAWRTKRQAVALKEMAGASDAELVVEAALHPAKAGALPWTAFLPAVLKRQRDAIRSTNNRRRQAVRLNSDDWPQMHTVSHHQKLAVIDQTVLYVGGLDLNERRWDTPRHDQSASQTWSDVQVLCRGPEAAEAHAHLKTFVAASAGKEPPSSARNIKRTLSAPRAVQFPFLSPKTVLSEIEETHMTAFKEARHHIHIETQYMRSSRIADALAQAGQGQRDLGLTLVLPSIPEEIAFEGVDGLDAQFGQAKQAKALNILREGFGRRLCITAPVRPTLAPRETLATLAGSPVLHVHNKVLLVDDARLMIGSANLNGRSMRWDTEVAVQTLDPESVLAGRDRLFAHWWFDSLPQSAKTANSRLYWWQEKVRENSVMRPENRYGFLVGFDAEQDRDLRTDLPGVTEDIV